MSDSASVSRWWVLLDGANRAIRIHADEPESVPEGWTLIPVQPETPEERTVAGERWFVIVDVNGQPTQTFTPLDERAEIEVPVSLQLVTVRRS